MDIEEDGFAVTVYYVRSSVTRWSRVGVQSVERDTASGGLGGEICKRGKGRIEKEERFSCEGFYYAVHAALSAARARCISKLLYGSSVEKPGIKRRK